MLSGGEVAALIVAVFWAVLVCFIAFVLVRLGRVVGETAKLVSEVTDSTIPLIGEVTTSVVHVNTELERVDIITANVQSISTNVSGLTALLAATFGGPVIKVAAFSYGVRRVLSQGHRKDAERRIRTERRARRLARRQRT